MHNIIHMVGIKAEPNQVYSALTTLEGLSSWWSKCTGESKVGGKLGFYFGGDKPFLEFEVIALEKNQLVAWKTVAGAEEWLGTEIRFSLFVEDGKTMVSFKHAGWESVEKIYSHCNTKWAVFLVSLKQFLEDGKGRPFPNDIQIN